MKQRPHDYLFFEFTEDFEVISKRKYSGYSKKLFDIRFNEIDNGIHHIDNIIIKIQDHQISSIKID